MNAHPSHPAVGTVLASQRVTRTFGSVSHRKAYTVGYRYTVRRPDGSVVSMTASEWDRAVTKATPRNVHMLQPDIKVGAYVSGLDEGSGYMWHGEVIAVNRQLFTIRPAELKNERVDFAADRPIKMASVMPTTREFEQFRTENDLLTSALHNEEHALCQQHGIGMVFGSTEIHKKIAPEVEARRAKFRADFEALRQKFPTVTDSQAYSLT